MEATHGIPSDGSVRCVTNVVEIGVDLARGDCLDRANKHSRPLPYGLSIVADVAARRHFEMVGTFRGVSSSGNCLDLVGRIATMEREGVAS